MSELTGKTRTVQVGLSWQHCTPAGPHAVCSAAGMLLGHVALNAVCTAASMPGRQVRSAVRSAVGPLGHRSPMLCAGLHTHLWPCASVVRSAATRLATRPSMLCAGLQGLPGPTVQHWILSCTPAWIPARCMQILHRCSRPQAPHCCALCCRHAGPQAPHLCGNPLLDGA